MVILGTCLWFDDQAEEAARFYTSVVPRSRIVAVTQYAVPTPSDKPVGSTMTVEFELDGHPFTALNGGPHFTFNEAVSIVLRTDDQAETDRLWDALLEGGGEPGAAHLAGHDLAHKLGGVLLREKVTVHQAGVNHGFTLARCLRTNSRKLRSMSIPLCVSMLSG